MIARLEVTRGPLTEYPLAEKVSGGWQNGVTVYPDEDVTRVTELVVTPAHDEQCEAEDYCGCSERFPEAVKADTVTVPRPHVPFGPNHVSEDQADAEFLRAAVENIRYAESNGRGLFGSNLTNTVCKLLNDVADALDRPVSSEGES